MLSSTFWTETAWRAIRTFAQTALAAFGGTSLDLFHANITGVLSVACGAAVLSLLMSVDRGTAVVAATIPAALVAAPVATLTSAPAGGGCGNDLR